MGYLKNGAQRFTKVTEYNKIGFNHKTVEDKDGKENSKEAITNSEEKVRKKKAQRKAKKDAMRALLLVAMPRLSTLTFASIFVLRLSTTVPELSAAVLGLSVAMPRSSTAMPRLSTAVPGLFALTSAFVSLPGLSALLLPSLSAPVLSELSLLLFPVLFLPKILTPDLARKRPKLDDIIGG